MKARTMFVPLGIVEYKHGEMAALMGCSRKAGARRRAVPGADVEPG